MRIIRLSKATAWLAAGLLILAIIGCAETPAPPATPLPPAPAQPAPEPPTPEPRILPPPAPTPTDEERRLQTPTEYGNNTRIVDGDLHVWHVPICPPVPPASWVASIILTDLRSGSHLYLNRDGSVRTSPAPDYRSDEGRERFDEVLQDSSLMELILAPMECP